jgi:hypothetical protein
MLPPLQGLLRGFPTHRNSQDVHWDQRRPAESELDGLVRLSQDPGLVRAPKRAQCGNQALTTHRALGGSPDGAALAP